MYKRSQPIAGRIIFPEPYKYLMPALLIIVVVYLYPVIEVVRFSFLDLFKWPGKFIGIKNYVSVFSDQKFYVSLLHSAQLLLIIPVIILFALILAVILFERIRGWKFFRSVVFIPAIVPMVAIGIAFSFFYTFSGAVNQTLNLIGLDFLKQDWLANPRLSLFTVSTAIIWREVGFGVLLFLARLGSISEDTLDAAKIDGAGWWTRLFRIYIPELASVIEFYIVITIITILSSVFGLIFAMTNGGPGYSTWVSEFYIYKQAFGFNQMGKGTVMAVVLMVITVLIVFVSNKMRKKFRDVE